MIIRFRWVGWDQMDWIRGDWSLEAVPRVGDTMVFTGDRRGTVQKVEWHIGERGLDHVLVVLQ